MDGAHITNADIKNGDDSICMKSPARNILVENSLVQQGNGLVVGTSSNADFANITFRNCTAIGTAFGCHVKFKDEQTGRVDGVRFENIRIVNPQRYAIGINQNGQSLEAGSAGVRSAVHIGNVSYVNVTGTAATAGRFVCNGGDLACKGIVMEHVHIEAKSGCSWTNVFGSGTDVSPASCMPPMA